MEQASTLFFSYVDKGCELMIDFFKLRLIKTTRNDLRVKGAIDDIMLPIKNQVLTTQPFPNSYYMLPSPIYTFYSIGYTLKKKVKRFMTKLELN